MDIVVSKGSRVKVLGQIHTVNDSERLMRTIDEVCGTGVNSISILFHETRLLGSAVIGYLVKLTCKQNMDINIEVTDERLLSLIESMGLLSTLNVKLRALD